MNEHSSYSAITAADLHNISADALGSREVKWLESTIVEWEMIGSHCCY